MWLNEKHIEEELDHKNTQGITIKYNLDARKHRYELVDKPKNNPINWIVKQHHLMNLKQS